MKVLKSDFFKMRNINFFLFISICLILSIFYIINQKVLYKDFMGEQKELAQEMIEKIDENLKKETNDILIEEKSYYSEILVANNWKNVYISLNKIENLLLNSYSAEIPSRSDLPFDHDTNIKLRNYNLKNDINPDERTIGNILYDLFYYVYDFLSPLIVLLISAIVFIEEYENRSIQYLYTSSLSYHKIIISKWITIFITSFGLIFIPLLFFAIILIILNGFSNPNILFNVAKPFADYTINNFHFITISNYYVNIFIFLVLGICLIDSLVICITILFKKKNIILSLCILFIMFSVFINFILPAGRTLSLNISLDSLCLFTLGVMLASYAISLQFLKKCTIL